MFILVSGDEESYSSKGGSPAAPRSVSADDEVAAAAQAISCVAILIQHPNNALAMRRARGLRRLINIINESEHNEVHNELTFPFLLSARALTRLEDPSGNTPFYSARHPHATPYLHSF